MTGNPYHDQARAIRRALLVTAYLERQLDDGGFENVRLSDQMRRVLELVNELSFGAEQPASFALVRSRAQFARGLSMDPNDARDALDKAVKFKVLKIEDVGEGWLRVELCAARLAVTDRALEARAAIDGIERAHRERVEQTTLQLEMPACERSHDLARDPLSSALDEVEQEQDRETLARLLRHEPEAGSFPAVRPIDAGSFPVAVRGVSPHAELAVRGVSPHGNGGAGSFPASPHYRGAGARADSPIRYRSQIGDSPGCAAEVGSAGLRPQFRNPVQARLADALLPLIDLEMVKVDGDRKRPLTPAERETSRRTWIGRIRDYDEILAEAWAKVRDEIEERGKRYHQPLGKLFVKAATIARATGRTFRMFGL